jgi:beta-phosphoglucomutase-like phosphatase (HAD superfamily)
LRATLGDSLTEPEAEDLARRKETLYRESYRSHLQAISGLLPFLSEARSLGVSMAVATSANEQNTAMVLDDLEI